MQTKAINPYNAVVQKHKDALDFIATNLPADPTFDNLNEVLVNSIFSPTPDEGGLGDLISIFVGTVLPNAYNGYVNSGQFAVNNKQSTAIESTIGSYVKYTDSQLLIISKLLDGIKAVPVENIGDYIVGMEAEIAAARLSYVEQAPLFLCTASAKADYDYWFAQINNPGSLWASYLNNDLAINYLHIGGWVQASTLGALLTYGMIKPPEIQLLDVMSGVVGSIGLVAGKVVFGWVGFN